MGHFRGNRGSPAAGHGAPDGKPDAGVLGKGGDRRHLSGCLHEPAENPAPRHGVHRAAQGVLGSGHFRRHVRGNGSLRARTGRDAAGAGLCAGKRSGAPPLRPAGLCGNGPGARRHPPAGRHAAGRDFHGQKGVPQKARGAYPHHGERAPRLLRSLRPSDPPGCRAPPAANPPESSLPDSQSYRR